MTTILDAATEATVQGAAYAYIEAGCSIIPVRSKKPAIFHWDEYKTTRSHNGNVRYWLQSDRMQGIGLICGAVSGNLVVLDVDSMQACEAFETSFPLLRDTLTIRSGSGRGRHYYFYADQLPINTWLQGVELRADGAYVVAAPSIHTSGHRYLVERHHNVKRVTDLEDVRDWIQHRAGMFFINMPKPKPSYPTIRDGSRYGKAALTSECISVQSAPEGSRNNTLYRAALKMGSLINGGHLSKSEVEYQLENAAFSLAESDGIDTVRRTIQSGLIKGMSNPNTRQGA